MKNLNLATYGVEEMNQNEMVSIDGGFNWGMFWSGCKIGLGVGGAVGVAVAINA